MKAALPLKYISTYNFDSNDYALIDDKNMKHPSSENTPQQIETFHQKRVLVILKV